jgi:hypothetical protein
MRQTLKQEAWGFHVPSIAARPWERSHFPWEAQLTDVSASLRELSEPWGRGDKIKAAIARAARAADLSYWRAFDIWYGKARRIEPDEAARIAAALQRKSDEHARNELHELRTRLLRLESLLVQTDPDFHRPTIDQTRDALRNMGRSDRPLARKR